MRRVYIIAILMLCSGAASADESGMSKYRNYTPQLVKDMSAEKRRSEMPMIYTRGSKRRAIC